MKSIQKYLVLLVCMIVITGCTILNPKNGNKPTIGGNNSSTKISVTYETLKDMEKVADAVFNTDKESLKVSDLTAAEKGAIARNLVTYFQDYSGSEMTKNFQKYFGEDQTVTYEDIPCFEKHNSEEEQILYTFDKEKDKYVTNEKHPGHGGGGKVSTQTKMELESLDVEGDTYTYNVKVLFYGPFWCYDVGGCNYGKAYKSGADAKNETNALVDLTDNKTYMVTDMAGFNNPDMDKVMKDYKDKLDTYQFIFEKENGNLIFKEYKKA